MGGRADDQKAPPVPLRLLRDHVDLLYERAGRVDRQRAAGRQHPLLPDGDAVRADDDGLAGLRLVCR